MDKTPASGAGNGSSNLPEDTTKLNFKNKKDIVLFFLKTF